MVTERVLIRAKRIATILLHVLTQLRTNIFSLIKKKVGDYQNLIQKQTSFPYGIKISMKKHENLKLDFTLIGILMSIEKIKFELNLKNLLVIHAFKWLK